MNMMMIFIPSDAVAIHNNIDNRVFWFDYRGVREIIDGDIEITGVDMI